MQEKTPLEVNEMIKKNPILKIIDVREQWEYDKCHIANSTHIPMGKIPDSINEFDDAYEYVIVCHHGIRSRMVGLYFEQNDFKNIINLRGGIDSWAKTVDNSMATY